MPPDTKNFKPKVGKPVLHDQQLCSVRFSPDGQQLAGGTFVGSIRRWDTSADPYALGTPLTGHHGWVQSVAFHPSGESLFSVDSWGQLSCWSCNLREAKARWTIPDAHIAWAHALAVRLDGKMLATAGRDQTVRLANPDTGAKVAQWSIGEDVLALAFYPDGSTLLTGDLKGRIIEWEVATQKKKRELDAKAMFLRDRIQDVGGVRCFAFNSDASKLFAGGCQPKTGGFVEGRHLLLTYDWKTGNVEQTYKSTADADGFVHDLIWHANGYLLAVTSGQPGQGKVLGFLPSEAVPFFSHPVPNGHSLALHPKGVRLVVAATNANSSGNGRPMTKDKDYPANSSPLHTLDLPT